MLQILQENIEEMFPSYWEYNSMEIIIKIKTPSDFPIYEDFLSSKI